MNNGFTVVKVTLFFWAYSEYHLYNHSFTTNTMAKLWLMQRNLYFWLRGLTVETVVFWFYL